MLTIAGLLAVTAFMAWVAMRSGAMGGSWTGGSPHILAAMVIAGVGAGGLAAGLIWLAFFSARRGYDERAAQADELELGPE
jgi:hypothetical protein